MHNENKHLSREEAARSRTKHHHKITTYKYLLYGAGTFVVLFLLYWGFSSLDFSTYSDGSVHWHATLDLTVCGENVPLPSPIEGQVTHGQSFIGTPLMHSHGGSKIHVEGTVAQASDITLGKFMKSLGLTFTSTQLLDSKNGDACGQGKEGEVMLFVNGKEEPLLDQKVIQDKEKYEIKFE